MGDEFTVADAYLPTIINWTNFHAIDLTPWLNLESFMDRVARGQRSRRRHSRGAAQGGLTAAFGTTALRTGVHAGGTDVCTRTRRRHYAASLVQRPKYVRLRIGRSKFRSG